MIPKELAVELVEAELARERLTWRWLGPVPELAVYCVEEHTSGWLVFWSTAKYARTRDQRDDIHDRCPYVVDRQDGSLHHIPAATWMWTDDWEEVYLRRIKGGSALDPVVVRVRAVLESAGVPEAMRQLRALAPRLTPQEALAYVRAVRDGAELPEALVELTWDDRIRSLPINTVSGPIG